MSHPHWSAASSQSAAELAAHNPYGEITSTLDWCEENLFSPVWFMAEFFNSISNLGMLLLGLYGAHRSWKQRLPQRFIVGYLALALVGVGSLLFHATLLFESQLSDELPMLWADAVFLFCMAPKRWREDDTKRYVLLGALAAYALGTTAVYLYTRSALFFESAYALGVVLMLVHCVHWAQTEGKQPRFAPQRRLIAVGAASLVGAFAVWNVDNLLCDQLRALRAWLGSPLLAPLLQFHAWWHLGAGYATYLLGVFVSYRDEEMCGRLVHGKTWFGLPILIEVKPKA